MLKTPFKTIIMVLTDYSCIKHTHLRVWVFSSLHELKAHVNLSDKKKIVLCLSDMR